MKDAPADEDLLPVAAICHDGSGDIDALLADFVAAQRRAGLRVLGLLMQHRPLQTGCECDMVLTDIATGDEYKVSQSLGAGSSGCRADPQGFARASGVLRAALHASPDLVVCNRFGSLEASGGGFVAELLELMAAGIPVLIAVAPKHQAAWQRFVGDGACDLPLQPQAWADWLGRLPARG